MLRRGARILRGAGCELHAVYVARADGLAGPSVPDVAKLRGLCEDLGGTFHAVTGDDAATAVLEFATALNATEVVVGASRSAAWRRLFGSGVTDSIIAGAGDIDVLVVTHDGAGREHRPRRRGALPQQRVLIGLLFAVLAPALLSVVLAALPAVGLPLIMLVFLMATVLVALVGGMVPALVAAVVSSLLINWFFTPPLRTFTIARPENVVAILVFLAVAAAVATVVHRSARRAAAALEAQRESTALAELTYTLLGTTDQMALLLNRAADMFGAEATAVVRRSTRDRPEELLETSTYFEVVPEREPSTREAADTEHDLVLYGPLLAAEDQRLLAAFAAHAGAILHRRELQRTAGAADTLARDNRARTALLSAVSHDLRTPLAAVKAAIGSLRSTEVTFGADDRAELESVIEEAADRLSYLVDNLLDMSRLQAGALVAHARDVDLGEVVPNVVHGLSEPARVEWSLSPDARRVVADPGLLDRVLGNLVENAVRHAPPGDVVRLTSSRLREFAQIRVIDRGPGVSEAQRERMFLPFQRLGDAPAGNGVGLGLAVARGLTEAMGGTIEAEDTPGGGLTVVVWLPTQHVPSAEGPVP